MFRETEDCNQTRTTAAANMEERGGEVRSMSKVEVAMEVIVRKRAGWVEVRDGRVRRDGGQGNDLRAQSERTLNSGGSRPDSIIQRLFSRDSLLRQLRRTCHQCDVSLLVELLDEQYGY